jgi:hypothetical protein
VAVELSTESRGIEMADERYTMIGQTRLLLSGVVLPVALLAAACSSNAAPPHPSAESPRSPVGIEAPTETSSPGGRVTMADAKRCPVTLPTRFSPPPGVSADELFGSDDSYGNGRLWVGGLWPRGVIVARPDFIDQDGSVGMKFGWWRQVSGYLRITGRRLDAPAPPLRADVPAGYGRTGFQASGVYFPDQGCWEVTGKVGGTALTFVTFVIKQSTR